jgi:endonuclease-3
MQEKDIHQIIPILREKAKAWPRPVVDAMGAAERSPYQILITTILSARTKDRLTAQVAPKLFALANTPAEMVQHSAKEVERVIYPVGFYRAKAQAILAASQKLLDEYGGQVPDELEELLKLPGVGRKTANLVVTVGFKKPGICVDTHVHRISNRWGYIQTQTPSETEEALRQKLPPDYWLEYNGLLVSLGQTICHPTSPRCGGCPVGQFCQRVGVTRHR